MWSWWSRHLSLYQHLHQFLLNKMLELSTIVARIQHLFNISCFLENVGSCWSRSNFSFNICVHQEFPVPRDEFLICWLDSWADVGTERFLRNSCFCLLHLPNITQAFNICLHQAFLVPRNGIFNDVDECWASVGTVKRNVTREPSCDDGCNFAFWTKVSNKKTTDHLKV